MDYCAGGGQGGGTLADALAGGASEGGEDDERDLRIQELKAERALLQGRVKALQHQMQMSKYKAPGTP